MTYVRIHAKKIQKHRICWTTVVNVWGIDCTAKGYRIKIIYVIDNKTSNELYI